MNWLALFFSRAWLAQRTLWIDHASPLDETAQVNAFTRAIVWSVITIAIVTFALVRLLPRSNTEKTGSPAGPKGASPEVKRVGGKAVAVAVLVAILLCAALLFTLIPT